MRPSTLRLSGALLLASITSSVADDSVSPMHRDHVPRTASAAVPAVSPTIVPMFSRRDAFYIPFSVQQAANNPVDVLLFASADQGTTWKQYARQPSSEKQFLFRAAGDGEYWFASRMIPSGSQPPSGIQLKPELRIVVDTEQPALKLNATSEASGDIYVSWEASDVSLRPETVTLEYQTNPGQTWQPLEIERPTDGVARSALRGDLRWKPERRSAILTVRLKARDNADNVSEATRRLILPFSFSSPFGPTPSQENTQETSTAATGIPADPFSTLGMATPGSPETQAWSLPPSPHGEAAAARGFPPANRGTLPNSEMPRAAGSDFGAGTSDAASSSTEVNPFEQVAPSAAVPWPNTTENYGRRDLIAGYQPSSQPAESPLTQDAAFDRREQEVTSDGYGVEATDPQPDQTSSSDAVRSQDEDQTGLPPGERPHMTNSKKFNLDYSVDAVGPMGLEKVELWITRNQGRDWDLWGVDEDRQSPLLIEVEDEGIYGFRVVLVGKNGLASKTPRAGDLADLWVGVDSTLPVVELTSAAYGEQSYAGQLDIRWTAMDDHFGARPVSISFSEERNGPWTTVVSGLPNSGQYYWRVDSRVPDTFFLRLEVRDAAGNTQYAQTDQPIRSAGLKPRGRIRSLNPLD